MTSQFGYVLRLFDDVIGDSMSVAQNFIGF